jgi:hypothetical protein
VACSGTALGIIYDFSRKTLWANQCWWEDDIKINIKYRIRVWNDLSLSGMGLEVLFINMVIIPSASLQARVPGDHLSDSLASPTKPFINFPFVPSLGYRAPFGVSVITHTRHTVGLFWTSDQPVTEASTYTRQHNI